MRTAENYLEYPGSSDAKTGPSTDGVVVKVVLQLLGKTTAVGSAGYIISGRR